MEIVNFELFVFSMVILTITPGLDTAIIIRNTTRGGVKDGVITSFGICSGLFVHALLSAVGVSAILLQSAQWFSVIKMLGAAYLIWLGITGVYNAFRTNKLPNEVAESKVVNLARSVREGFLSNVLNPKTAIFYLAFLPQFISPHGSILLQSLFLALIHFVIAMVWQSAIAMALHTARNIMQNGKVLATIESITGGVLIVVGLKLMLQDVE